MTGPVWRGVVECDDNALVRLAAEWDDLYDRCPRATPFQTSSWLRSWWSAYGVPGRLRVVLARCDERLVGAAAFTLSRRGGVSVLRPVGTGISDWTDMLLDPEHADGAALAIRDALLGATGWHAVDLVEVPVDGSAHRVTAHWPGPWYRTPTSVCQQLAAARISEIVTGLSSSKRADVRRALRRIEDTGVTCRFVTAGEFGRAVERLLELHRRQWAERGRMNPEHGKPRFGRHLVEATRGMRERGQAELVEYWIGGRLVASGLLLVGHDSVGGYLYGAEPDLFGRVNVTTMLMQTALDVAVERARPIFSMMRGRESYKASWRPETTYNERLVLCRSRSTPGASYACVVRLRSWAVARLRSRAPGVRSVALRVQTMACNPVVAVAKGRAAARRVGARLSGWR